MTKKISMWLGILVAVCIILGSLWKYDKIKADAAEIELVSAEIQLVYKEIQLVSSRLDQKIINDNIRAIQQRIWDTQMYYQKMGQPIPPEQQRQINQMQADIQQLQRQLGK